MIARFPDGKPDDVAVLDVVNPIPEREGEENVDNCIYSGQIIKKLFSGLNPVQNLLPRSARYYNLHHTIFSYDVNYSNALAKDLSQSLTCSV